MHSTSSRNSFDPPAGAPAALLHRLGPAATPLGAPEQWPPALAAMLRLALAAPTPMLLLWGESLFQLYNDAFSPLLGDGRGEAFGRRFGEAPSRLWSVLEPVIPGLLAGGPAASVPEFFPTAQPDDPEEPVFSLSCTGIEDEAGMVLGVLVMAGEVTRQRQAEARLRRLRALADASGPSSGPLSGPFYGDLSGAEIGAILDGDAPGEAAFLAGIDRDFRIPLTLMLGPLEDLLAADTLPAAARGPLGLVERNALRLLRLVEALPGAARRQGRFRPTPVAALTRDTAELFGPAMTRAGLGFVIDCADGGVPAWLDRGLWESLLFDLLDQALQRTTVGSVSLRLAPRGESLVLSVEDSGAGGAAEAADTLALARRLAALQGGRLALDDAPGQGRRVAVTLPRGALPPLAGMPAAPEDILAEPPAPAPEPPRRRARLLLLVPDADLRAWLQRLLAVEHEVLLAADGVEGLRLARHASPELLLADAALPGLDAAALLRRLRADPATRALPVILLSARGVAAAGADDHVKKPFAAQELLARVRLNLQLVRLRRELEESRHQARKMQALGELASGVAHDFNNLLAAVTGSLELAGRHADGPRLPALLDNALSAAARGAVLTRQLLGFARRQRLLPAATELPPLLEGLRPLLQRALGPAVRLEIALPPGLWPALVDAPQLELVLLNLALDAGEAMPGGGFLAIAAANEPTMGMLRLTLRDGSAPREPALAEAQAVLAQMGGSLSLDMAAEAGRQLTLSLRRATFAPAAPKPDPETPPGGLGLRLLVVDDDEAVRRSTVGLAEALGCAVLEAEDGAAALRLLAADSAPPIDALLVDYAMPGMDGATLLRAARALRPGLPALLVTGYAGDPGLEALAPVLPKPFRAAELQAALQRLAGG
ncbi:hypothetical protein BKE38_26350 [Pseudoroseomonas deserti]|uniref:histidine kinase n=1 Tax=Teichococcus deserti TaxID=1817963 RepID=A0A1V2GVX5_9PROT|nr:response regulator [Pseudoroseomonas deserti]ONG45572.1 hypothetical protein BKE38_26350 [Pseudoroseomonas deserti]